MFKKIYEIIKGNKNGWLGSVGRDLPAHNTPCRQGDSDRSDIRVFEERLAAESDGDWLCGSRTAQESFSKWLIATAKENSLFLTNDECHQLGERKKLPSGESVIYTNAAQGMVYKVRDPFAKLHLKSPDLRNILYEHIVHNILFPDTSYSLVGITEEIDSARLVLSQRFVFDTNVPNQNQIDEYLAAKGLFPEGRYYYGNDYLAVTDVNATGDNVFISEEGQLKFIDPIIKIKKTALETIDFYCN